MLFILEFLTDCPEVVKVGNNTSATLILNKMSPQGCVHSPLLYSLFTHDSVAKHDSNTIIKLADDTTVVGLITDNNETTYREEVRDMAVWCQDNNLSLNVSKTKEMIVDYGKRRTENAPIHINGALLEREFRGVQVPWCPHHQQTMMVQTHQDSRKEGTSTTFPSQKTEKTWNGSPYSQKVLQLYNREHLTDWLQHSLVWQKLGIRPQGSTEGIAHGAVHHWGQASCHPGPIY
jgi:hypothetical protein